MKRLLKTLIITLAVSLLFAGCGSKTAEPAKQPTPAEVTAAVMSAVEFMSPVEKTTETIGAYYTDLDTNSVESMSVYVCGSGAYPDEIAVFKFKDEDGAKAGFAATEKRFNELVATYTDYTPDEMYKLESPVLEQKGNYVIFIDCSDNAKAKEITDAQF
jgi:predicted small lipoprotein YifL